MNTVRYTASTRKLNNRDREINAFRITDGFHMKKSDRIPVGTTVGFRMRDYTSPLYHWQSLYLPVRITKEYPNFLIGTVLEHDSPKTGCSSKPYPITINKHDLLKGCVWIGEVAPHEAMTRILTLRELKTVVSSTKGVRKPEWEKLRQKKPIATFKGMDFWIKVYPNGFIAAGTDGRSCGRSGRNNRTDGRTTVFRIEDCGSISWYSTVYKEVDYHRPWYHLEIPIGRRNCIEEGYFLNLRWEIRVLMEAEKRMMWLG